MVQVLNVMKESGPKYGYLMNLKKSVYVLGKCGSLETAEDRKSQLIRLGLEPDNIKIHPDDAAMDIRINEENLLEIKANYGAKNLGSYILTLEFPSLF